MCRRGLRGRERILIQKGNRVGVPGTRAVLESTLGYILEVLRLQRSRMLGDLG